MPIQPVQCRMARAVMGWSIRDLAERAKVHFKTIDSFERGGDIRTSKRDAIEVALRKAFENTGVELRPDGTVWAPQVYVSQSRSERLKEWHQAQRSA